MKPFLSLALAVASLAATASPMAASAHPHMYVDAQSTLVVDADGRVSRMRTALVVDPLTTQYVLDEYGIAPDAPLTDKDRQVIAEGMVGGLEIYGFFTEIKHDGATVEIASASISQVQIHDDLLAAALDLTFAEPIPLDGAPVEIALFDPTYFAAVNTLGPPVLPDALSACAVDFVRFEPEALDSVTLMELSQLAREETPSDPRIGARFADRSRLTCGG